MEINKDIADLQAAENRRHKVRKFVLCYHNFNVKNCKRQADEIRKIAEAAGSPISIAVVPSIGGVPESEAEQFREEIRKFKQDGYEIILHGARHRADLFVSRNPWGKVALWLSRNGAEFAGLNKKLSQALLNRSLALWKSHGFDKAIGFVAPVWMGNPYLKAQALENFDFYEDLCKIYKNTPGGSKEISSRLFTFSVIPRFFQFLAIFLSCISFVLPYGTPRLVFHTEDFKILGESRVLGLVRCATAVRENIKYGDL